MGRTDWDQRFSTDDYVFGTEPDPFLVEQEARLTQDMMALAVADGEGRNGVWLAERVLGVVSVDGSERALQKAHALAESRGVALATACVDLLEWTWPVAQFELVVSLFFHPGPEDRPRLHRAMCDALLPGGLFLYRGFHPDQLGRGTGGPPDLDRLVSAQMLRDDLPDAEILSLEEREVQMDMKVDDHVPGLAKVTELVARKA